MKEKKIEDLGGEYISEKIIERSKDTNIIYLTEDVILNTNCVKQLAEYIENLINRNKELEVITNGIKVLETNGVNDDTFYVIAKTDFLKGSYKHLLDDYIPKSKVKEYKEKFIKDNKEEKVFMTQSSQINASLISFCDELLEE